MIEPLQIVEESDREISIKWSDDAETRYRSAELRKDCPCASCVNEWTGEKILDQTRVDENTTFAGMSIVGRYALNFRFSDGHDTGIYSFAYLRKLAE